MLDEGLLAASLGSSTIPLRKPTASDHHSISHALQAASAWSLSCYGRYLTIVCYHQALSAIVRFPKVPFSTKRSVENSGGIECRT